MKTDRREQIRQSLRSIVEYFSTIIATMEEKVTNFCEELSLDPWTYLRTRQFPGDSCTLGPEFVVDRKFLCVRFQGKTCFLGNTLPFKLLYRLARQPNVYISHEDLLSEVWECVRSDAAVRSTVKMLRQRLRKAGLGQLADAIDGTARGHYALKIQD